MRRAAIAAALAASLLLPCGVRPGEAHAVRTDPDDEKRVDLSQTLVDLNSAGEEDLLAVPGVTASVARAIVDRRRALGCIRSLNDLLGAGGLTELDLAGIRPYVSVGAGCRGMARRGLGVELGWWSYAARPDARARAWAGDLSVNLVPVALRLRARPGSARAFGGAVLRFERCAAALGDLRGRLAHPIALELGRGVFECDGPFPGAPRGAWDPGAELSTGSLQATTGAGERLRGAAVEIYGRARAIGAAGTYVGKWDAATDPLGLASARIAGGRRFELWGGAIGWGAPASGAVYTSVSWAEGSSVGSAGLAVRRSGGAWLLVLSGERGHGRRLGIALAGRWGRYDNPVGLSLFRAAQGPVIASRVTVSAKARGLGSVECEEIIDSASEAAYLKRVVRLRREFRKGVWGECEVRTQGESGCGAAKRCDLRLVWKHSGRDRCEFIYAVRADGGRSTLCGWRALAEMGAWELELGGFSFQAPKSLYFYEREIIGLSTIKALKGEGMGWYIHLRLEPSDGPGSPSFLGSVELKVRTVLGGESSCGGTYFGVQFGRR